MGNKQVQTINQRLGWGGVPDTDRATYFNERLMMGWIELLCCPSAMGCTVMNFKPKDPSGGEPVYKIKLRLSHNEHVPRYQLHIVSAGKTRQSVVGHLEKTETHLRAKPGEFVRVQVWKACCSTVVMEKRRSALNRTGGPCPGQSAVRDRPTPSAQDMQLMGMTIATQAKLDQYTDDEGRVRYDPSTERWNQTIAVDNKAYKLSIEQPAASENLKFHQSLESINVLRIICRGKKEAVARKQRFAGALGRMCQPYLGVQIKPPDDEPADADDDEAMEDPDLKSLLNVSGLMVLLLTLAWSEETMSPLGDMSQKFITAMRAQPGEQGSAEDIGLSVQWDTDDVQQRLAHLPFAVLHNWNESKGRKRDDDDDAGWED
eukprot:gnl/TRDRNA2_/TRDRNA2_42356_c0_seq1.p1 gnl/TRDRNA2_/TRDRNA2_42356_c0~~gnl/TRDRNA2_/TRDRNA2_42356_c0_seq1.p1  ORF type:complete len:374 (-),score=79.25 gnl/TRDRNA2_/TRDRNA2_42356_c0_seq1:103-1224(-)